MTTHTPPARRLNIALLCALLPLLNHAPAHAQPPPGTRAPPEPPTPGLSAKTIQRVVRDATPRARRCYDLHGHLLPSGAAPELGFTIQADGSVSEVTLNVRGEPAPDPPAACLRAALGLMVFPPVEGGGVVRVRYPRT